MRQFNITVNGVAYSVAVEEVNGAPVVSAPAPAPVAAPAAAPAPVAAPVAAPAPAPAAAPVAGGETVKSPMPGTILDVCVSEGAIVKSGTVLVVLEAMKMENEIMAPCDGVIKQIRTSKGATVNSGDVLVVIG